MDSLPQDGSWTLLNEQGGEAINFTSFIDIDYNNEGQALSYPVEFGGFANYNKVESPLKIHVTLSTQGSDSDFEYILSKLDEYKKQAVRLAVSTPCAFYESMTLVSFSYRRGQAEGAGILTVALSLDEVREVRIQSRSSAIITKPLNPSSHDKSNTGKVQTADAGALNAK